MDDFISRTEAINSLMEILDRPRHAEFLYTDEICSALKSIPAADVVPIPQGGIGEVSDGYHTFNALYYQRMMLFAALVKAYRDRAWKSYRHEDGELWFGGGWFVVGIDTPEGSYTYHYECKDFDLFDCEELPVAKHWDGHTEKDVTRLLSLPDVAPVKHGRLIDADNLLKIVGQATVLDPSFKWKFAALVTGEPTIIPASKEADDA